LADKDEEELTRTIRDGYKNGGKTAEAKKEPPSKPVDYPKTEDVEDIRLKRLRRFQ